MSITCCARRLTGARSAAGFSLAELTVSAAVTSVVSVIMVSGMMRLSDTHTTIHNRSDLHAGVRGATELLQHEVSQAGRLSLPGPVTLNTPVNAAGSATPTLQTANLTFPHPASEMFVGEQLVIDTGANQETVTVTAVNPSAEQVTAVFANPHAAGAPVTMVGGFGTGIISDLSAKGSTGSVLKLYGDIYGDGHIMYVEYTCNTATGNVYRNVMPFNAASKPALSPDKILLTDLLPNPGNAPCFTYQDKTVSGTNYVIDVAITLTLNTHFVDPVTHQQQTETKALLNVAPRNVFESWQLTSLGITDRLQPMPASVQALLP